MTPTTQADPARANPPEPRRRFLGRLAGILGALAAVELGWVASIFIRPRARRRAREGADLIVAGPVAAFAPGSVTAFPEGKFYLSRLSGGGFLALHRRCTHLGCTLPWNADQQRFVCPCHASAFDPSGDVLSPPAARPLDLFPVRIENGIVKVDVRQPVERAAVVPEQEKHP
jgi:cytochrome b6-f complex iron-sulfur subunit